MNDVIIIGGGPAGSVLGSYLAKGGLKVTILESANHPRAHVGESLVMSTYRVFKDIDFLEKMDSGEFVRKYGASWHSPNGKEFKAPFNQFDQEGIPQHFTWHVDRSKFDLALLKQAEKNGAKVIQGVHVKQVLFENDHASGVRAVIGGQEVDIPAKFVADASGRGTLLGNQLKIKVKDPIFDQYAVHAWFKNLDRDEDESKDFIHIYFLPIERGWVWQIPITDEITSVGVVADKKVFRDNFDDLETYFYTNMKTNPKLEHAMRDAERINDFKTEGDYSYCMSKFVGNGWLLVGDAARFVDPIFSSGVSVALYSARFASEYILKAFETGQFSEEVLKPYEVNLRKGVEIWYEFIRLYYKLMPLFTHFIQHPKLRLEVMRLLQGEVFERQEIKVLDAMRAYIEAVEKADQHIFKKSLTGIPIDTSMTDEIMASAAELV
jgi:1H-pyrrole-2-carbonyl-[peptidyl-carrier protein] chlorinase